MSVECVRKQQEYKSELKKFSYYKTIYDVFVSALTPVGTSSDVCRAFLAAFRVACGARLTQRTKSFTKRVRSTWSTIQSFCFYPDILQ